MKSGKIYRIAALLLALFVALSLSSICVFADGEDATATGAGDTTTTGTDDATATGSDDATATGSDDATATGSDDATATGTDDATATGSDDATATGSEGDDASESDGETTGTAEETTGSTADSGSTDKSVNWDLILTLSVIGLAIIVFFVFFFASPVFRGKVQKFFKDTNSELKKVVWSPWRDVKKNTVIVIVVSLGAALLIFILDMLFSKGLSALTTLVG